MFCQAAYGIEQQPKICALVAGCQREPFVQLSGLVSQVCQEVIEVNSLADIGSILRARKDIGVLLCAPELPHSNWVDVAALVQSSPQAPMLILCVETPQVSTWTKLLELGGYTMCAAPWYIDTIRTTVESAWKRWQRTAQIQQAHAEGLSYLDRTAQSDRT